MRCQGHRASRDLVTTADSDDAAARLDRQPCLFASQLRGRFSVGDETATAIRSQLTCRHNVVGVAATETDAVHLASAHDAGLILADINLGRGGNGIRAVREILSRIDVPVIFVTAYPKDLLTAQGIEPAFVMRKPFGRFMFAVFTYQTISAGYVPLP
jgi:CheY-like chemotaxis protein